MWSNIVVDPSEDSSALICIIKGSQHLNYVYCTLELSGIFITQDQLRRAVQDMTIVPYLLTYPGHGIEAYFDLCSHDNDHFENNFTQWAGFPLSSATLPTHNEMAIGKQWQLRGSISLGAIVSRLPSLSES